MYGKIQQYLKEEIQDIKDNGLYKEERIITSPQGAEITLNTGQTVLNFCANNYLGLSSHQRLSKLPKTLWTLMVLECHLYDLYVAHRISTKHWNKK